MSIAGGSPANTDAAQRPSALRRDGLGWMVVGAYLAARAWQLFMMGPVIESADSPMYRAPGADWWDFGATSWDGSSLRPWPTTLLYALLPTDRARVLAQFALATLAWACLLRQLGRLPVRRPIGTTAAVVVAVLALTPSVSSFDVIIGAESISFTLVATFSAAVLQAVRVGPRPGSVLLMLVSAWAEALVRPVLGAMLLVPLLLVAQAWRRDRTRSGNAADRGSRATGSLVRAAVVLLLVGLAGLNVLAYNAQADREWGAWRGTPGLEGRTIQQWGVLAQESPVFPELLQEFVAEDGAPACLLVDAAQVAQPVVAGQPDPCPQGREWVSTQFLGALAGQFAEDPLAARRYLRDALTDVSVMRGDGLPSLPTLIPDPITGLYFAPGRYVDVFALWTLLGLAAPAVARGRGHRRLLPAAVWLTLAAAYLGLLATAFLSPSEVSRVGLPSTLLARVFLVVSAALLLHRIRTSRSHGPPHLPGPDLAGSERARPTGARPARTGPHRADGAGARPDGQQRDDTAARPPRADVHRPEPSGPAPATAAGAPRRVVRHPRPS